MIAFDLVFESPSRSAICRRVSLVAASNAIATRTSSLSLTWFNDLMRLVMRPSVETFTAMQLPYSYTTGFRPETAALDVSLSREAAGQCPRRLANSITHPTCANMRPILDHS